VPVTGLAGARIPSTTLVEGRTATVIGLVRRPYPGAADRRWSLAPRNAADLAVGVVRSGGSGGDKADPGARLGPDGIKVGDVATTPNVDLLDLAGHVGQTVRVGGLVTELVPDGFLLDDGTAVGQIVLRGQAAEYLPLLEPGDALNATGRVEQDGTTYRIAVDDPAGIVRVGDPTFDSTTAGDADVQRSAHESDLPETAERLAGGLLGPGSPATVGVLGIVLVSTASLAVTVLRRRRARRRLAAQVGARLAGVTATHGPD
jgi:hypothetical protein